MGSGGLLCFAAGFLGNVTRTVALHLVWLLVSKERLLSFANDFESEEKKGHYHFNVCRQRENKTLSTVSLGHSNLSWE